MPDLSRSRSAKLTKIHAGCYRHEPSGRLVLKTDGWGLNKKRSYWEHATQEPDGVVVDGTELFRTRREAVAALGAQR